MNANHLAWSAVFICVCVGNCCRADDLSRFTDTVFDRLEERAKEYDLASRIAIRTYVNDEKDLSWWEVDVKDDTTREHVKQIVKEITRGLEKRRAAGGMGRMKVDYMAFTHRSTAPITPRIKVTEESRISEDPWLIHL